MSVTTLDTSRTLRQGAVGRHVWTARGWFAKALLASLAVNLLILTPTLYMLQLYERVLYSMNPLTLAAVSLLAFLLLVLMGLADRWRGVWLAAAAHQLQQRLQQPLYQSGWRAALGGDRLQGSQVLRDLLAVRQSLAGPGAAAVLDLPWTPIYVAVTWLLHPVLGIAVLGFLVLQALLAWKGHALSVPAAQAAQTGAADEAGHARRQFRQADTVAALGMGAALRQRWLRHHQHALGTQLQAQALSNRLAAISKTLRYLQQSAALGLGGWLVARGEISAGAMIAGTVLTTRALAPVDAVVSQWKDLLASRHAVQRIDAALQPGQHTASRLVEHTAEPGKPFALDDVSAWLPGAERAILHGISLAVPAGQVLAVLGPSGAGKSTLAQVMAGVWPNAFGGIWRLPSQAGQGYLPQDVVLLPGTVAENIARMGMPDPGAVVQAAQRVGLHDIILRLPKGYDTVVGEGGHPLSGGMTQRIGLARALYGEPRLLILDEPTAHLDEAGELALEALFSQLRTAGCTVVLITHARTLLRSVDRIVMLDHGRIVTDELTPPTSATR